MSSSQTMQCFDNDCLWHRLTSIPSFQMALNLLLSGYQDTKQLSPFVERTFGAVENTVSYAAGKATPIYETYLQDKVSNASKFAANKLEYFEEKVPAVKMTPKEMREAANRRWEESYVHAGVNAIAQVPEYSRTRYNNAQTYVYSTLDNTESYLDQYVPSTAANSKDASLFVRLGSIAGRSVQAVDQGARNQVNNVRLTVQTNVENAKQQFYALDAYSRARVRAANDSVYNFGQSVRRNLTLDQLALNSLKFTTQTMAFTSHKMYELAAYANMDFAALKSADGYVTSISDTTSQAPSIYALKDTTVSGARSQLKQVEAAVYSTLDAIADRAPVSWIMGKRQPTTVKTVTSNGTTVDGVAEVEPDTSSAEEESDDSSDEQ